jgi:hypothetical protein
MRLILLILSLWAVLVTAQAHPAVPDMRPYSCRLLDDARHACNFGQCDAREIERLTRECIRDHGRP